MYRFLVATKIANHFLLSPSVLNHLKSIRLQPQEKFICIYEKRFYVCQLEKQQAKILYELVENHEYQQQLVLFAALIKPKHFEWLIQKATELGVKDFYPLISSNTNPKYIDQALKKQQRWQEISNNAAEQAFRNQAMQVHLPISFEQAIKWSKGKKYLAHEIDLLPKKKARQEQFFTGDLAFYVGPEGGFTTEEINWAQEAQLEIVFLGQRILRSETAALWLLANVKDDH